MEHDEIILDCKINLRNKGTRFGLNTRNSVKRNWQEEMSYRWTTGFIQDLSNNSARISLSKRKNWEILNDSFLESDSDILIVKKYPQDNDVDMVFEPDSKSQPTGFVSYRRISNRWVLDPKVHFGKYYLREPKAPTLKEPQTMFGTNRKGFFTRQARLPGKRGVHQSQDRSRTRSIAVQKKRPERVIQVERPNSKKTVWNWTEWRSACKCDICGDRKFCKGRYRQTLRKEAKRVVLEE